MDYRNLAKELKKEVHPHFLEHHCLAVEFIASTFVVVMGRKMMLHPMPEAEEALTCVYETLMGGYVRFEEADKRIHRTPGCLTWYEPILNIDYQLHHPQTWLDLMAKCSRVIDEKLSLSLNDG